MKDTHHLGHIVSVILAGVVAIGTPALMPGGVLAAYSWAPLALAILVYVARLVKNGPFPPAAVLVVLAPLLFGGATCKNIPGPIVPPGDAGPSFVNCSDAALHQAVLNILPAAETAIAQADYEAAVAALIAGIGGPLAFDEVACAIQWIASKAALQETATGDTLEATKAAHARAWLAAHPVTFQ